MPDHSSAAREFAKLPDAEPEGWTRKQVNGQISYPFLEDVTRKLVQEAAEPIVKEIMKGIAIDRGRARKDWEKKP